METSVRGFSFMPDTKVEATEPLVYIQGGELERTWKSSRRQRLKEQEQKVWEEFVKEQDVIKSVYKDDPYQFLHQLPESCLQELMDVELKKVKKEVEKDIVPSQGEGDSVQREEDSVQREEVPPPLSPHAVTFAEETDDCDLFHIFSDKDDPSGPEDECLESTSPCTVRERDSENASPEPLQERDAIKSSENVSNVIESSIYCAKVKDLRFKIRDEMLDVIATLERLSGGAGPAWQEREEAARARRRVAEFSARFTRIHVYQLQRQMQDVRRNTLHALPFAQHTHFHAQMQRVASLHQSLLQACQVYHKSMQRADSGAAVAGARETAAVLHSLALVAREASELCAAVPRPRDLDAAALYTDEMLDTCDKLDEAVCEHSLRMANFISSTDNTSRSPSRKSNGKGKRRMRAPVKSTKSSMETETRLSMYSLDTLRLHQHKAGSSRDNHSSGTSKRALNVAGGATEKPQDKQTKKGPKRSPRSRGPLMRGGEGGVRARVRPRAANDSEITTMVEAVEPCPSSRASREPSLARTPRTPRTSRTPRKAITPRPRPRVSPKAKIRRGSAGSATAGPVSPRRLALAKHNPIPTHRQLNIKKPITEPIDTARTNAKDPNEIQLHPKDNDSTRVFNGKGFDSVNESVNEFGSDNLCGSEDKLGSSIDFESRKEPRIGKDLESRKTIGSGKTVESGKILVCGKGLQSGKGLGSGKDIGSGKDLGSYKDIGSSKELGCEKDFESGKDFDTCSSLGKDSGKVSRNSSRREGEKDGRSEKDRTKASSMSPARCEVTKLLKQLCSGDAGGAAVGNRSERVCGAKNAQLVCLSAAGSPRQPSTPQLLRILEETIQKKAPKPMYGVERATDPDRFRMSLSVPARAADRFCRYRTRFVQHMLASPLYANSAVDKPWEIIGSVSDQIIDEVVSTCATEMQLRGALHQLYRAETR